MNQYKPQIQEFIAAHKEEMIAKWENAGKLGGLF